jgi:hypothetical protein
MADYFRLSASTPLSFALIALFLRHFSLFSLPIDAASITLTLFFAADTLFALPPLTLISWLLLQLSFSLIDYSYCLQSQHSSPHTPPPFSLMMIRH